MKTLELELKKKVLIVDESDFDYFENFKEGIYFKLENGDREFIEGQFFILCKGSQLTEEIASELVDKSSFVVDRWYHLAKRGFKANIESKGFHWMENPFDKAVNVNSDIPSSMVRMVSRVKYTDQWKEAEEKTFKNPLIFVKK